MDWNEGASSIFLEPKFGLPTSTDYKLFTKGANLHLSLTLEHNWGDVGILAVLDNDWVAERDFNNWDSTFSYQFGFGARLHPSVAASFLAGENENILNAEIAMEWQFDTARAVEFTLGGDLEGDHDAKYAEIVFSYGFR